MATSEDWELQLQESDRRFYQNLNEIRLNWGMSPITHPSLQAENEENERTIFIKIHHVLYLISEEILDQVFSSVGEIESIEIFDPPIGFHSKVQFQNKELAIEAFNGLNGRNIYDRCCQLELFLVEEPKGGLSCSDSISNNKIEDIDLCDIQDLENKDARGESNGEIESPIQESEIAVIPCEEQGRELELSPQFVEKFNDPENSSNSSMYPFSWNADEGSNSRVLEIPKHPDVNIPSPERVDLSQMEASMTAEQDELRNFQDTIEASSQESKVTLKPCEIMKGDGEIKLLSELDNRLIEWIEIRVANGTADSVECMITSSAHKVFVEMRKRKFQLVTELVGCDCCLYHGYHEPRGVDFWGELKQSSITMPFDRGRIAMPYYSGKEGSISWGLDSSKDGFDSLDGEVGGAGDINIKPSLPFDRGKVSSDFLKAQMEFYKAAFDLKDVVLVFDPGGRYNLLMGLKFGLQFNNSTTNLPCGRNQRIAGQIFFFASQAIQLEITQ